MAKEKTVDAFIENAEQWNQALKHLRKAALSYDLDEAIKWQYPVYSLNGKNVLGLAAFKKYVGIWFFQGGLLEDKKQKLLNAQPGKTKAMLQWRFESEAEVKKDLKLIHKYMSEAVANAKAGKEIKKAKAKTKKIIIPDELKQLLNSTKKIKKAFDEFTPSKQREFCEYISEAKREATKLKRLEKIKPMIING